MPPSSSPHRVFVSYDRHDDPFYKQLLQAWEAEVDYDFVFDSPGVARTTDVDRIRRSIDAKLARARTLLVLVGARTRDSPWVTWEIEKAKERRLRLAAVKLSPHNASPQGLLGVGTAWARSFRKDHLVDALERATPYAP